MATIVDVGGGKWPAGRKLGETLSRGKGARNRAEKVPGTELAI